MIIEPYLIKECWNKEYYLENGKLFKSKGYVNYEHWHKVTKAKKEQIK